MQGGTGLGFRGIPGGSIAVELDFISKESVDDDLLHPHLCIQYRPKRNADEFNNVKASSDSKYCLAERYLDISNLTDGSMHNVRVIYRPEVNQLNFKEKPLTFSPYLRNIMMESENNYERL